MNFSEQELEDWLWENPDGGEIEHWIGRQTELPSGRLDLLGVNPAMPADSLSLFELKAVPLTSDALSQVCRHANDLSQIHGVGRVAKTVICPGGVSNKLQFEADALGVAIRQVCITFAISEAWGFTEDALDYHRNIRNEKTMKCGHLRMLKVRAEAVDFLGQLVDSADAQQFEAINALNHDLLECDVDLWRLRKRWKELQELEAAK